jgi:hypothetical protein
LDGKLARRLLDEGERAITRRRYGLHLTILHPVRGFALADFLGCHRACTLIGHGELQSASLFREGLGLFVGIVSDTVRELALGLVPKLILPSVRASSRFPKLMGARADLLLGWFRHSDLLLTNVGFLISKAAGQPLHIGQVPGTAALAILQRKSPAD